MRTRDINIHFALIEGCSPNAKVEIRVSTFADLLESARALERALFFAKSVWECDDPNEPIADNGMTVWDQLQKDARYLAERAERAA